jgi:endonuclease/exonuclease/phosphatase family metal-dependent hydrolase
MTRRVGWGLIVWIVTACSSAPVAKPPNAPVSETAAEPGANSPAVAGEKTAPSRDTLKVATWNLEWLNRANGDGKVKREDADYERLRTYAEKLNADIVAVQEVDGVEALRRVFDDAVYDYHVASQPGVQLTGFAYKATLHVTKNPDYAELDVGSVRTGTDLTVTVNDRPIRLLSVHLKSGCFDQPLTTSGNDCAKLSAQLPALEAWIDARAAVNEAFGVLGDFNRRMKTGEPFFAEIDDGDPANADLTLTTDGRTSTCWGGEYPQFIDHIVLSRDAAPWVTASSFAVHEYEPADSPYKSKLSDHCPLSVALIPGASPTEPPAATTQTSITITTGGTKTVIKSPPGGAATVTTTAGEGDAKKDEPKSLVDQLKGGELVQHGVTLGAAVAMQVGVGKDRALRSVATSFMPYLAILPRRWWIYGDVTKAYCTSAWRGQSAQDAADALAMKLALERGAAVTWPLGPSVYDAPDPPVDGVKWQDAPSWEAFQATPALFRQSVWKLTGWVMGREGICHPWVPGLYVGIPLGGFTANGRSTDSELTKAREFKPLFATGFVFAPFTYFSLLAGLTLSNVKGDDEKNRRALSATIGLGGNIDVFSLLLK